MHEQERLGIGAFSGHVQIMQIYPMQGDFELWESVEAGFVSAPVETGAPIVDKRSQADDISSYVQGAPGAWSGSRILVRRALRSATSASGTAA